MSQIACGGICALLNKIVKEVASKKGCIFLLHNLKKFATILPNIDWYKLKVKEYIYENRNGYGCLLRRGNQCD